MKRKSTTHRALIALTLMLTAPTQVLAATPAGMSLIPGKSVPESYSEGILHLARKPGRQERIDQCFADARLIYRETLRGCDRAFPKGSRDHRDCYRNAYFGFEVNSSKCDRIQ